MCKFNNRTWFIIWYSFWGLSLLNFCNRKDFEVLQGLDWLFIWSLDNRIMQRARNGLWRDWKTRRFIGVKDFHDWVFLLGFLHSKVKGMALLAVQNVLLKLYAFHLAPDALNLLWELLTLGGLRHVRHLDVAVHIAPVYELFSTDEATFRRIWLLVAVTRIVLLIPKQRTDTGKSRTRRTFLKRLRHERKVERLPLEEVLNGFELGLDALVDRPLNLPNHRIELKSSGLHGCIVFILLGLIVRLACGSKAILLPTAWCV